MSETDKEGTLQAREALMQQWADVMTELVQQFHAKCAAGGINPEWYYPRTIVEKDETITIHWGLRPDVEIAMKMMADGHSAEAAAKAGMAYGGKSLDELIANETVWE